MDIDIKQIFEAIQNPDKKTVNKQFLIEILINMKLNIDQPEYFRFIFNQLQKMKQTSLTQQDMVQLFHNQNVQYDQLQLSELTYIFKCMDTEKKGAFSAKNFIDLYKQTDVYKNETPENQNKLIKQIQIDFSYLKTYDQEVSPMDFYDIMTQTNTN